MDCAYQTHGAEAHKVLASSTLWVVLAISSSQPDSRGWDELAYPFLTDYPVHPVILSNGKSWGYIMTIEYKISQGGQRIDTFPKGVLDIRETIDYFWRLKNDKNLKQGSVEIVHFKYVTDFKISYLESKKITESYQEPKTIQIIDMTIFVCETDLAYGIGRMLQALHEIANPRHKVVIVRTENDLRNVINKI
jgi:hypothetical protein